MADAPSNIHVTSRSVEGITWRWDEYSGTSYSPAFHIQARDRDEQPLSYGDWFQGTYDNGLFSVSNAEDGTKYEIRVRAVLGPDSSQPDGFAYSDWSDWTEGVTLGEGPDAGTPPDTAIIGDILLPGDPLPGGGTLSPGFIYFTVEAADPVWFYYKIDNGSWSQVKTQLDDNTDCGPGYSVSGTHTLYVRAMNEDLVSDPTPASKSFTLS